MIRMFLRSSVWPRADFTAVTPETSRARNATMLAALPRLTEAKSAQDLLRASAKEGSPRASPRAALADAAVADEGAGERRGTLKRPSMARFSRPAVGSAEGAESIQPRDGALVANQI